MGTKAAEAIEDLFERSAPPVSSMSFGGGGGGGGGGGEVPTAELKAALLIQV